MSIPPTSISILSVSRGVQNPSSDHEDDDSLLDTEECVFVRPSPESLLTISRYPKCEKIL